MLKALLNENLIIENEYYNSYIELISKNSNRKYEKYLTEKHHIVPRCYFKRHQPQLLIDNSKDNLVNLLHRDHILAHYYLSRCANGWLRFYLLHAFYQLFNRLNKNKYQENILDKDLLDQLDQYQELFEETLKLKSELYKGRTQSEEQKEKRLKTRLERYPNGVITNLGKKHLMKDGVGIFVSISELDEYLKSGWVFYKRQMSEQSKQKMRDTKAMNKKPAWNKGLTKETDQRVAKNAESTSKSIQKLKLENPEFWKQHLNTISKNKKGSKPGNLGKICVFNPDTNHRIYIFEYELDNYKNLGYHKGKK